MPWNLWHSSNIKAAPGRDTSIQWTHYSIVRTEREGYETPICQDYPSGVSSNIEVLRRVTGGGSGTETFPFAKRVLKSPRRRGPLARTLASAIPGKAAKRRNSNPNRPLSAPPRSTALCPATWALGLPLPFQHSSFRVSPSFAPDWKFSDSQPDWESLARMSGSRKDAQMWGSYPPGSMQMETQP